MAMRRFFSVVAGAIDAAVNAARATILGKSLPKMFPCSVQSYGEVVPR